jgi:hypothetical protein
MPYVYRVENKFGCGCYDTSNEEIRKHHKRNGHPVPNEDVFIGRKPEKYEYCGFLNLRQVMKWFTNNELRLLADEGFKLKRIKVDKITAIGESQVLFLNEGHDISIENFKKRGRFYYG